jgi:hypothetical protein
MDKLAPVIKHHFWILFVIALILPPVGWWMTTSELAAEIDSRRSTLDSAFSSIPSDPKPPNEDWKKAADGRILTRKEQNRLALDRLWKSQTDLMVWPPNVAQYMTQCPYRGDHPDYEVRSIIPSLYRDDYEREINRIWLITEPDRKTGNVQIASDTPQKVLFPLEGVPRVPRHKWTQLPPTWREIWNAQEDIWLLGQVFTAVRNVNQGTESITDANIKQIMQVQLFGGTRSPAPAGGAAASTSSGYPGMSPMGGGFNRGGASAVSAEFPMTEEYTVADTLGGGGGAGARGAAFPTMTPGATPGGAGATTGTDPNADASRYVAKEAPYRSRGFKIRVSIDQMRVPDFIKELLNSDYATTITRYQWTVLNAEDADGTRSRSITLPSAGGGGFPGSDYGASGPMLSNEGTDEGLYTNLEPSGATETPADYPTLEPGMSSSSNSGSLVQSALGDTRLVDLVVVGEMYIYNPPEPVEGGLESTDSGMSDTAATAPEVGGADGTLVGDGNSVEATPISTTAPASGATPVATDVVAPPAGAGAVNAVPDGNIDGAPPATGASSVIPENNPVSASPPVVTPPVTPAGTP